MGAYEAAILDVDGTIIRGDTVIPGAVEGVQRLDATGITPLLFSNNPTRGPAHYREKLRAHGLTPDPDRVLTSASVTAAYLADTHPTARVYLLGEPRLERLLVDAGIELTEIPSEADVVLASIDRNLTYDRLSDAVEAVDAADAFYGTDPDLTIPVEDGSIPGSGTIIAAIEAAAGRSPDAILGKPAPVAAEAALSRLDTAPENVLVVGDRLDTDIALGKDAGMETAIVLTGITDRAVIEDSPVSPDHVLDSLGDVGELL